MYWNGLGGMSKSALLLKNCIHIKGLPAACVFRSGHIVIYSIHHTPFNNELIFGLFF